MVQPESVGAVVRVALVVGAGAPERTAVGRGELVTGVLPDSVVALACVSPVRESGE